MTATIDRMILTRTLEDAVNDITMRYTVPMLNVMLSYNTPSEAQIEAVARVVQKKLTEHYAEKA